MDILTESLINNAMDGNLEEVKRALDAGANVDSQNMANETALMWAAENGHFDVVRYLLDSNAKIDVVDNSKNTALMRAIMGENLAIISYLLDNNAKVNHINHFNQTPLDLAIRYGNSENINLLIARGAISNSENIIDIRNLILIAEGNDLPPTYEEIETQDKKTLPTYEEIINSHPTLLDINKKINDIEKNIIYFQQKKINSVLNFVIGIFSFGCINTNKPLNKEINELLIKKKFLNEEKQLFEKELNFNKAKEINAMDLQNQPSTSGYQTARSLHS